MAPSRRDFLTLLASTCAGCAASPNPMSPGRSNAAPRRLQGLAFDAFVLFDPRSFLAALSRVFGQDGPAAVGAFRARLFDYGWLRVLGGRYRDFSNLLEDALDATALEFGTRFASSQRTRLLSSWHRLPPWPDARVAVPRLHAQGLKLGVLSNWTPSMLRGSIRASGLPLIALSTHRRRTYKPSPDAYDLGVEAFSLEKASIGFVAFAAWDAAGAHWFGYPTLWMNRTHAAEEQLDLRDVPRARSFNDPAFQGFIASNHQR